MNPLWVIVGAVVTLWVAEVGIQRIRDRQHTRYLGRLAAMRELLKKAEKEGA